MKSILIVDDDANIRELLRLHLTEAMFRYDEAEDGKSGLEKALAGQYDLVILDVNLPEMDGLEVCRRLRAASERLPIMMLTSRREEIDRVLGLEIGADDYMTKPFAVRELLARVKAILRRSSLQQEKHDERGKGAAQESLSFGELQIDLVKRKVTLGNKPIAISNMEFELLTFLASAPGRPFTREQLLEEVWGYRAVEYEQNVSTHITRLRKKLEPDPEKPTYIKTVRGFGYAFVDPAELAGGA